MKFLFCLFIGALTARLWFRVLANTSWRSALAESRTI